MSSGSNNLTIGLKLETILQNIWMRVIGSLLINISPIDIFPNNASALKISSKVADC